MRWVQAVLLPEDGVEKGLAPPGVAHLHGVATLDHPIFAEILVDQRVNGPHPYLVRDVAGFELAHELVNVDSVTNLDGDPG
jgi:hypothetical protein